MPTTAPSTAKTHGRPAPRPAARRRGESARLTGHSGLLTGLQRWRLASRRHEDAVTLAMFALDRFAEVNERCGSSFGDRMLRWFARNLLRSVPHGAIVARSRGNRYVVALRSVELGCVHDIVHRCRRTMDCHPLIFQEAPQPVTASVGIATTTRGFLETEEQLLQRAAIALAHAKHHGGNRMAAWDEIMSRPAALNRTAHVVPAHSDWWMHCLREQLRLTCVESTRALVAAVEAKDPHYRHHSLAVCAIAEELGRRMNLPPAVQRTLNVAALLHDIGKIGVPDSILTKPGALTPEEMDMVKGHPQIALDIIRHVSYLHDVRPVILHHHERWDGTGYPAGLREQQIPIAARVLATADALDAMFSARSYKAPYSAQRVAEEIRAGAGGQFDPAVSEATLAWINERPAILHESNYAPPA